MPVTLIPSASCLPVVRRPLSAGLLLFILMLLGSPAQLSAAEGLTLSVQIDGVSPRQGQVILSLFNSEETYLKSPYKKLTTAVGDQDRLIMTISNLVAGTYAVSVVYDQDGDGKMKRNFIGMPREPVGMSNNAKGMFGPPSYANSKFDLNVDLKINIRLTNVKK